MGGLGIPELFILCVLMTLIFGIPAIIILNMIRSSKRKQDVYHPQPPAITCSQCGLSLPAYSEFCNRCGTAVKKS